LSKPCFAKSLPLWVGGILLLALSLGTASAEPVAVVNGVGISNSDFNQLMRVEAARGVLGRMIENEIVKQAFDKAGLEINQKDLHDGVVETFQTVAHFLQVLADNGVDEQTYLDQILKPQIMLQKLATQGVKTDDASLKAYYAQNAAQYDDPEKLTFRVIVPANADDAAKALAAIKAGQDFAAVAKQYSADPNTRDNGGLAEDVPANLLPQQITDALAPLKEGETTGLVQAPAAQFILKLEKRVPGRTPTFEELKPRLIKDLLAAQTSPQALAALREQLREAAKVEVLPADLASVAKQFGPQSAPPPGAEPPPAE
jgi:parvulin-like peptidyl-prolyl isomerase